MAKSRPAQDYLPLPGEEAARFSAHLQRDRLVPGDARRLRRSTARCRADPGSQPGRDRPLSGKAEEKRSRASPESTAAEAPPSPQHCKSPPAQATESQPGIKAGFARGEQEKAGAPGDRKSTRLK